MLNLFNWLRSTPEVTSSITGYSRERIITRVPPPGSVEDKVIKNFGEGVTLNPSSLGKTFIFVRTMPKNDINDENTLLIGKVSKYEGESIDVVGEGDTDDIEITYTIADPETSVRVYPYEDSMGPFMKEFEISIPKPMSTGGKKKRKSKRRKSNRRKNTMKTQKRK